MSQLLLPPLLLLLLHILPAAASVSGCEWTSPGGDFFDLSQLNRIAGHYQFKSEDHKFTYYFNVCGDVGAAGYPCASEDQWVKAPAFQGDGSHCRPLGSVAEPKWNLIDPKVPHKGLELTYDGGESCGQGNHRMTKFHFICAPGFDKNTGPLMVREPSMFKCHYNVTWPTKYACPTGSILWETWHTVTLLLLGVALYSALMYLANVQRHPELGFGFAQCPSNPAVALLAIPLGLCVGLWHTIRTPKGGGGGRQSPFQMRDPLVVGGGGGRQSPFPGGVGGGGGGRQSPFAEGRPGPYSDGGGMKPVSDSDDSDEDLLG